MTRNVGIPLVFLDSPAGAALRKKLFRARTVRNDSVQRAVEKILAAVRKSGDRALFRYTAEFDKKKINATTIRLDPARIAVQAKKVPVALQKTIREAAKRIKAYHARQKIDAGFSMTSPEGRLKQRVLALKRAGVYIPGGYTAYPSTVLMDVIPAQIAGVEEIVAVTPPRDALDPAIAFVLNLLKVREVYQIGGAQAIGALAFGTESVKPVDCIVGPGNSYVAIAKKLVYGTVAIDTVAGPSEVAVLADDGVHPAWVALDLLSQAEHGSGDEVAVCVTEDAAFAGKIRDCLLHEIEKSPSKEVFRRLPGHAISIFVAQNRARSIEFINMLAPEHLQIMTRTCRKDCEKISNAAAIFLGPHTPVALGDYFVGTNHVLPTGTAARYASPLGVDTFLKRVSVAEVDAHGLKKAASHVSRFARAEGFIHHAISVERRVARQAPFVAP